MIRKLRRRYIITNMALLSSTLVVGLAVLFGMLYRSEVQASYTTMEQLIHDSSLPEPPREGMRPEIEPEAELGGGAIVPLSDASVDWRNWQPPVDDGDDDEVVFDENDFSRQFFNPPPFGQQPPYWDFPTPDSSWDCWHDRDRDRSDPVDDDRDDDNGGYDQGRFNIENGNPQPPQWDGENPAPLDENREEIQPSEEDTPVITTAVSERQPRQEESGLLTRRTEPAATAPAESEQADPGFLEPQREQPATSQSVPETAATSRTTTESETKAQSASTAPRTETEAAASGSQPTDAAAVLPPDDGSHDADPGGTPPMEPPPVHIEGGHYVPDAYVARVDEQGNIESYAGNGSGESGDELQKVHHAMDTVKKTGNHSGTVEIGDTSYRYLYQPNENGEYRLVLLDRSLELSTISKLLFIFLLIAMIGLLCMFGISVLLANWTVTPIAEAWEKQKQFVADASHELKTPLAVISANTEVILSNPQESVSGQSKWLNYIQSETMRMSKLITNLLSVARMDSEKNREHAEPISLSELVSSTCLVFEPIIFEHGKTLNTVIQRNVSVRTDSDNMKQLLSILLDNAVQHSVPKAQITVTLSRDAQGKIRLAVANTAKDIPPEQLAHLFDRFYRVDTENCPNGSGLGLSIARSITRQMGGKLTVTSENQLVTFVATF